MDNCGTCFICPPNSLEWEVKEMYHIFVYCRYSHRPFFINIDVYFALDYKAIWFGKHKNILEKLRHKKVKSHMIFLMLDNLSAAM